MASKTLTLVSPDGKREVTVDSAVRETQLKFDGYTVKDGSDVQTLSAKRGPKEKAPVTAVTTPSADAPSETEAAGAAKPNEAEAAKPKAK